MQSQGNDRPGSADSDESMYDRRRLTYANTFDNPWKANLIRAIEWLTGKITIIRMLRKFQAKAPHEPRTFWRSALDVMKIDLITPQSQLDRIPKEGPVIIVANHPHGLVDGMAISDLISRSRIDYKVLTRSILTGIDEIAASFLIPVPFPHEEDAQQKGIEMRATAMKTLSDGGVVALFPSGMVACSETLFGPAIEAEWNVFTAKMIRRSSNSCASILPGVKFASLPDCQQNLCDVASGAAAARNCVGLQKTAKTCDRKSN